MNKTTRTFKKMKNDFNEAEKVFKEKQIEHNNRFNTLKKEFEFQEKYIKSRMKSYSK
ncbi:hypothetical protein HYO62_00220 [Aerococcaceae bacterium DSM 111022]|nr:hypothetical protein [Aerococcaceae bacterium DSM 111022]